MALTETEVLLYLGYEEDEIDTAVLSSVNMLIAASDKFVKAAVSANYPADDERMKLVRLQYIGELFDNRTLSAKTESRLRDLARQSMRQIRLEMRDSDDL